MVIWTQSSNKIQYQVYNHIVESSHHMMRSLVKVNPVQSYAAKVWAVLQRSWRSSTRAQSSHAYFHKFYNIIIHFLTPTPKWRDTRRSETGSSYQPTMTYNMAMKGRSDRVSHHLLTPDLTEQ